MYIGALQTPEKNNLFLSQTLQVYSKKGWLETKEIYTKL
jgi:hypothetical protein